MSSADGSPQTPRRTAGSFLGEMRSPRTIELPAEMPKVLRPLRKKKSKTSAVENAAESSSSDDEPAPPSAGSSGSGSAIRSVVQPLALPVTEEDKGAQRKSNMELDKRLLRLSEDVLNKQSGLAQVCYCTSVLSY